jgi:hypothetical protein
MTPLTNVIRRALTNNNRDESHIAAGSDSELSSMQWRKHALPLMLVAVALAVAPAQAQSSFASLPPANSNAIGSGPNAFALPSANSAERFPEAASIAPVTLPAAVAPHAHSNAKKWWVLSGIAMTAASLVDFGTSMGHNESNPALQSPNGQFSVARGLSLKLGLAGATMLFQALITRHHPELYAPSAVVNTVAAGAFGAAALHNTNTPQ